MTHRTGTFLILLLVLGCSTTGKESKERPDWLSGQSAKYSQAAYLLGRGHATEYDRAKDQARADLAKNFTVEVNERSEEHQEFQRRQEGSQTESQSTFQEQVARDLVTRTQKVVQGMEIAQIWQDPEDKSYYALAILSRSKASHALRQNIEALDSAIKKYVARAGNATADPLQKIALASKALALHRERDQLQTSLQIIDINGRGLPSPLSTKQLSADLEQLMGRISIRVTNSDAQIQDFLDSALAEAGFSSDNQTEPDYTLGGALIFDKSNKIDGVYWVTGVLEISLRSVKSGNIRGSKRWNLKSGSSLNATMAQRRTADKAKSILQAELRNSILQFAGEN